MSDNSPLFVSAIELLAHATEIFAQGDAKKNKFVILHLANAVELILKDCVIDQGISIYDKEKKQNTTITIWKCLSILESKSINVPELPVLELLIDDRNTIQHRFGYPDQKIVFYYLEKVVNFFKRLLETHYAIQLSDILKPYLSNELMGLLGLLKDEAKHVAEVLKLSISRAFLDAFNAMQSQIIELIDNNSEYSAPMFFFKLKENVKESLFQDLEQKGFLPENSYKIFKELRFQRNLLIHSSSDLIDDSQEGKIKDRLRPAQDLIDGLQKAKSAGYKFVLPEENGEDKL